MKLLKSIIFLITIFLSLANAQEKDLFCVEEYCRDLDNQYFDRYLNYSNFKNKFNEVYGERSGAKISVLLYDGYYPTRIGNTNVNHGAEMHLVGTRTRVSDDVEFILIDYNQVSDLNVLQFIRPDTKVLNASFTTGDLDYFTLVNELQKHDILVSQSAGNADFQANGATGEVVFSDQTFFQLWQKNVHYDNYFVVGQLGVNSKNNGLEYEYGNYSITDFGVYGILYYNGMENFFASAGTSTAAIVNSTITAQYYTIRPCWNYKDMKKFIYATLRPTTEVGITNDQTKTKKYLKYDTRIFDDIFVKSLGLSSCTGLDNQIIDNSQPSGNKGFIDNLLGNNSQKSDEEKVQDYLKASNKCNLDKNYQCAVENANKVIKFDPNNATAYNNRGWAYYYLGNYGQAIADINTAIKLNPELASAYSNRAFIYADSRYYNQAIADCNQAIALDSNDAYAYYNRGMTYYLMNNYNQAVADYTKAIQLNPNNAEFYNHRGVAYYALGKYDQAINDFTKAIRLDSKFARAYNNRGNAYAEKGDNNRATADHNRACLLDKQYCQQ